MAGGLRPLSPANQALSLFEPGYTTATTTTTTVTRTTTTTSGSGNSGCAAGRNVVIAIAQPVAYFTRPAAIVTVMGITTIAAGPVVAVFVGALMLATFAIATFVLQQAIKNCPL